MFTSSWPLRWVSRIGTEIRRFTSKTPEKPKISTKPKISKKPKIFKKPNVLEKQKVSEGHKISKKPKDRRQRVVRAAKTAVAPPPFDGPSQNEQPVVGEEMTATQSKPRDIPVVESAAGSFSEERLGEEAEIVGTNAPAFPASDVPVSDNERFRTTKGLPPGWTKVVRVAPSTGILTVAYYSPTGKAVL
jgi:hypothetical protein